MKNLTLKIKTRYQKIAPAIPALAFSGGFLWDAVNLGLKIKPSDLYIVMGYFFAAALSLVAMDRWQSRFSKYLPAIFQFFIGGVFSALVVFYFKSSAQFFSYLIVAVIAFFLVLNEFISTKYTRQTVSWLMLSICGTMFFNFFLPHVFGSVASIWFYLSIIISILIMLGLKKLLKEKKGSSWPAWSAQVFLLVLFIFNWIPPVPLVQKNMLMCHRLTKSEGVYSGYTEAQSWLHNFLPLKNVVHKLPGEGIYCFSSVFAPRGISTTIYHRWEKFNSTNSRWETRDRIGFHITSGRVSGYRGYSYKQNTESGLWRVKVEIKNGRIMGQQKFYIEEAKITEPFLRQIILN